MTQLFLKIYDALSRHRPWVAGAVCALALVCGVLALRMDYDEDIAAFMPLDDETRKYSEVFGNLGGQNQIAVEPDCRDLQRKTGGSGTGGACHGRFW